MGQEFLRQAVKSNGFYVSGTWISVFTGMDIRGIRNSGYALDG